MFVFAALSNFEIYNSGTLLHNNVWMVLLQVYDIAFSRAGGGRDMFASVGADGSVRMFDLRHLEHSTIIYEVCVDSGSRNA